MKLPSFNFFLVKGLGKFWIAGICCKSRIFGFSEWGKYFVWSIFGMIFFSVAMCVFFLLENQRNFSSSTNSEFTFFFSFSLSFETVLTFSHCHSFVHLFPSLPLPLAWFKFFWISFQPVPFPSLSNWKLWNFQKSFRIFWVSMYFCFFLSL